MRQVKQGTDNASKRIASPPADLGKVPSEHAELGRYDGHFATRQSQTVSVPPPTRSSLHVPAAILIDR